MYTYRNWARFKPPEITNILWALAALRGCQPSSWTQLLDKLAQEPVAKFENEDLISLYTTFMLLKGASGDPSLRLHPRPTPSPHSERVYTCHTSVCMLCCKGQLRWACLLALPLWTLCCCPKASKA